MVIHSIFLTQKSLIAWQYASSIIIQHRIDLDNKARKCVYKLRTKGYVLLNLQSNFFLINRQAILIHICFHE